MMLHLQPALLGSTLQMLPPHVANLSSQGVVHVARCVLLDGRPSFLGRCVWLNERCFQLINARREHVKAHLI